MVNIQIHNVKTMMWLEAPDGAPFRTLRVILNDGTTQDVSLFKAQSPDEKQPED